MLTSTPRALDRLKELLVLDVMRRNVTVIPHDATMSEAAETLRRRDVSGAPVVDAQGRCLGVLSAVDFLRFDESAKPRGARAARHANAGELPFNSVQRYMSVPVHAISPLASIVDAAQLMCLQHVHRLVVLNELNVPAGVISTFDIVSAVVHAVDEDRQRGGHEDAAGSE
jgi:CBS domain-containing protein